MRRIHFALVAGVSCGLLLLAMSCGGGGSTSVTPTPPSSTPNTVAITVYGGPSTVVAELNGVYVSVEVCAPGTSTCVTVPDVLLDTGSTGLRLLSDQVSSLGLVNVTSGGLTLTNCVTYLDNSYNWGPVATADVKMAGEVASSVPIQIIAEADYPYAAAPASCGGTADNSVDTLLANGILGVSFAQQDCGSVCESNPDAGPYYACNSTSCSGATVSVGQQVQNPVGLFSTDSNGVVLTLPMVPAGGAVSASGTLTFGIGTQSDNGLGSAVVLTPDDNGFFSTMFNGTTTANAFIDSGSSLLYFLQPATSGLTECTGVNAGLYCSTESLTATNTGSNGQTSSVPFSVESADVLLSSNNDVFSDLAGTGDNAQLGPYFDWGMPFFFGRSVFVDIEGQSATGTATVGPFWAY